VKIKQRLGKNFEEGQPLDIARQFFACGYDRIIKESPHFVLQIFRNFIHNCFV
jgi:hypothetical protein